MKARLFFILTLISVSCNAQSAFENYYAENGYSHLVTVGNCSDGGFLSGFSIPPANRSFGMVKIDSSGNVVWVKHYSIDSLGEASISEIISTGEKSDGNYYTLCLVDTGNNNKDILLVEVDINGNLIRSKEYSFLFPVGYLKAGQSQQSSDGSIYIMNVFQPRFGVMKVSSDGNLAWSIIITPPSLFPYLVDGALLVLPQNGVIAAAYDVNHAIDLAGIDNNGVVQWCKLYSFNEDITVSGINLLSDGNVMVTGTYGSSNTYGFCMKITQQGDPIWTRLFSVDPSETAFASTCTMSNGNIMIQGSTLGPDPVLLTMEADGNIINSISTNVIFYANPHWNMCSATDGSVAMVGSGAGYSTLFKLPNDLSFPCYFDSASISYTDANLPIVTSGYAYYQSGTTYLLDSTQENSTLSFLNICDLVSGELIDQKSWPITFYPNPASDYVTLHSTSEENFTQIVAQSMDGRQVLELAFNSSNSYGNKITTIKTSTLLPGIYSFSFWEEKKFLQQIKIAIVR